MEAIWIAVIGAIAAALGSFFTFLGTRSNATQSKLDALDARIRTLEARERVLWMYCQTLILHINQGLPAPAPPWPDELNQIHL